MPEPICLSILAAWAPPLVFALARLGFGRHGLVVHVLAALATYALAYASMRSWLAPLREPAAAQAFASVATIANRVDCGWAIVLFERARPVAATLLPRPMLAARPAVRVAATQTPARRAGGGRGPGRLGLFESRSS